MQKKLEGKLLKKILGNIEKVDPALYSEIENDSENLYLSKIDATSSYSPDIPKKMIEFFRGGFLEEGIIEGLKCYLPSIEVFCIINKINLDMIEIWGKSHNEMAYALKMANIIIEHILQNETLSSRNSTGALAILKARVGGKWKDDREIAKNQTFNIIMGQLGHVQGRSPVVNTPELASANPIRREATELVDPKTIDRVISVSTRVDVVGDQIMNNKKNLHIARDKDFKRTITSRKRAVNQKATNAVMSEVQHFLDS